ncbi:MAG TPA: YjdF family protein [Streptosporangiaceae bacterium]|nr:YjdF family protein [Streptosporangiaceae bacterium]
MSTTTFTVFFEDPFWVGVLETADEQGVRAARHVFGAEPSGQELYEFGFSRDYDRLVQRAQAGPPVAPTARPGWPARVLNPKRAARLAAKEQAAPRASTAAQAAIKAALEQSKSQRRAQSGAGRQAEAARRRGLARAKAKARHRGK